MRKKLRAFHRICLKVRNMKILHFHDSLLSNLIQSLLLIQQMHRFSKNILQQSSISFRCTKTRVLYFGGTSPYLFQKFFDLRLSDFLSRLFNVNMKLQQQKRMLNAFQGLSKLQKQTSGKNKRCSTVLTCSRIDRNLLFFYCLCSDLQPWHLLIEQMQRPLRSMLQHSLIPFRCTEIIVPNIGGTLPYLGLKSTNEKHRLF